MEGYTKITYKGKMICYVDYSIFQDANKKQKTLELLQFAGDEWAKQPLNSVLALVNVKNLVFEMDVLNAFKENTKRTEPNEKKVAVIGITGLLKTGYNFVVGLTSNKKIKLFDTELEAKEWLVSD